MHPIEYILFITKNFILPRIYPTLTISDLYSHGTKMPPQIG